MRRWSVSAQGAESANGPVSNVPRCNTEVTSYPYTLSDDIQTVTDPLGNVATR